MSLRMSSRAHLWTWAETPASAAPTTSSLSVLARSLGLRVRSRFSDTNPVAAGLAGSIALPGDNVAGFAVFASEMSGKRFALLRDIVPGSPGKASVTPRCCWRPERRHSSSALLGVLRCCGRHLGNETRPYATEPARCRASAGASPLAPMQLIELGNHQCGCPSGHKVAKNVGRLERHEGAGKSIGLDPASVVTRSTEAATGFRCLLM